MPTYKAKDEDFFKRWSIAMAYTLGFFCADGSMFVNPRGSKYVAFYSNDRNILEFIKSSLSADHVVSEKPKRERMRNVSYVLQFGSKVMYGDLLKLGLTPRKEMRMQLPSVPARFLPAFVRGYLDGDGNVAFAYYRKRGRTRKTRLCFVRFISGSREFLTALAERITQTWNIRGSICRSGRAWRLGYSTLPSLRLLPILYRDATLSQLPVLKRKYDAFIRAEQSSPMGR
jgi:intein-encoded DNA endonuclease-like protein